MCPVRLHPCSRAVCCWRCSAEMGDGGMHFDPLGMMVIFPKAMIGWAGVFAVTLVIIGITVMLNKAAKGK